MSDLNPTVLTQNSATRRDLTEPMAKATLTSELETLVAQPAPSYIGGWVGQHKNRPLQMAGYLGMLICILLIGVPVYWMIIGAFKPMQEIYRIPPTWVPEAPTLANFSKAWQSAPFGRYYINTIITTIFGSGLEIFFAVTSAYAFAFLRFPKKDWIFLVLLAALMVPGQVTILPNYLTIAALGWINTYQGIIVPGASVAYGTFLLRQYYRTLPIEVLDAAKVDGAGHLRILWTVVVPLAKPAIITFALLSIVSKWNDFLWPLLVTNTRDMRVLPIGIYWLRVEEGTIDWGVIMAGTLFVVVPVALVFLYAQRYIVDGIAAGAVKG
jgi:sn-glycerol 3-phosphate transport system permease protein